MLRILRRDTNTYLKLTRVCNVLVSLQYFMVPCSAQFMKRLGIQATYGKSFKDVCYVVLRSLSSALLNFLKVWVIVTDFNYSRKYSFANFLVYLVKESTSSRQDLDKLVANIPQLTEYGDFC